MQKFERVGSDKRPPRDAVLVTVWQSSGRTVADAAADDIIAEFPKPVPTMLRQAEQMRVSAGLARIVVKIAEEGLWRPEWGELVGSS